MQYRKLGRTGLFVSELCLGTMTYGGKGFWAQMGDLGLDAVTEQLRTAIGGLTGALPSRVRMRRRHVRRPGVARAAGRDTMRRC